MLKSREQLESKLEAIDQCLATNREYRQQLEAYLQAVNETMAETRLQMSKVKGMDEYIKSARFNDYFFENDFYRYDNDNNLPSNGLAVMRMIANDNARGCVNVEMGNLSVYSDESSASESEAESSDLDLSEKRLRKRQPAKQEFLESEAEDYEDFDTEGCRREFKLAEFNPFVVGELKAEPDGRAECFEKKLAQIVLSNDLDRFNIRRADLAALAKKANTTRFLTQTEKVVFPMHIYKKYRQLMCPADNNNKWTQQEDDKLRELVVLIGPRQWRQISNSMDGKTPYNCRHRWFNVVNATRIVRKWGELEDDLKLGIGVLLYTRKGSI